MNTKADFLQALADNPTDKTLPLIFADWLEEQGDPRSPWVRDPEIRPWMGEKFENPLPALIKSLHRRKKVLEVRSVIVRIGAPAVPALLTLLEDPAGPLRDLALKCLREMGPSAAAAVPTILSLLNDNDERIAKGAARALADIGVSDDAPTANLKEALASPYGSVRQMAARILGRLGAREGVLHDIIWQYDTGTAQQRQQAIVRLGGLQVKEAVGVFRRALGDSADVVREAAAHQVAGQQESAIRALLSELRVALTDPLPVVRHGVLLALQKLGSHAAPAVPELLANARHKEQTIRTYALDVLGKTEVKSEEVLVALTGALRDPVQWVRYKSQSVLIGWNRLPSSVAGPLLACIREFPDDNYCSDNAWRALGLVEDTSAEVIDTLRRSLHCDHWYIVTSSAEALGRIGERAQAAVPDLAKTIRRGFATRIISAELAKIGPAGLAQLGSLLNDDSPSTRLYALEALAAVGAAALPWLPRIRELLSDNVSESISRAASQVIAAIGRPAAATVPDLIGLFLQSPDLGGSLRGFGPELVPYLPVFLDRVRQSSSYYSQTEAIVLIGIIGQHGGDVVGPLRELFLRFLPSTKGASYDWTHAARCALIAQQFVAVDAATHLLPDLLPLLNDGNEWVRECVVVTLGELKLAEAISPLVHCLRDPSDYIRSCAARALGAIGPLALEASDHLADALTDPSDRVRGQVIQSLREMGVSSPTVCAALEQATRDSSLDISSQAAAALKRLKRKGQ